jgi:hypothetical protein
MEVPAKVTNDVDVWNIHCAFILSTPSRVNDEAEIMKYPDDDL